MVDTYVDRLNFATRSRGAKLIKGADLDLVFGLRAADCPDVKETFENNTILKASSVAPHETENSQPKHLGPLLEQDVIYPNNYVGDCNGIHRDEYQIDVEKVFPHLILDVEQSTFLDRVEPTWPQGNKYSTLTIDLGQSRILSGLGITYSYWDRKPEPLKFEAGYFVMADAKICWGLKKLKRSPLISWKESEKLKRLMETDSWHGTFLHTAILEIPPIHADCVRFIFENRHCAGRLFFVHALGPRSIWGQWGWFIKLLVLLQLGLAQLSLCDDLDKYKSMCLKSKSTENQAELENLYQIIEFPLLLENIAFLGFGGNEVKESQCYHLNPLVFNVLRML